MDGYKSFDIIAVSKYSHFSKKAVCFEIFLVKCLLWYPIISFILQLVSATTTYCGNSMVGKIITSLNFVMQSPWFLYFRSRHEMSTLNSQCRFLITQSWVCRDCGFVQQTQNIRDQFFCWFERAVWNSDRKWPETKYCSRLYLNSTKFRNRIWNKYWRNRCMTEHSCCGLPNIPPKPDPTAVLNIAS